MADTIIGYVTKYGEYTFEEKPLNSVDSLALCQLCYLKFDGMVPLVTESRKSVTLRDLENHKDFDKLFSDERFAKDNRALFQAMKNSRRFRNMKMNCYINIVEVKWETQFSAITFLPDNGDMYVAYRGTDETLIGWKEDFNMAFQFPVPGQAYAVKYLNMVTEKLPHDFYMGGHSKGGNLAVYAGMNCIKPVQERIRKIYSMDGPGFRKEVLKDYNYSAIEDRIVKILPHSSLVGMLFETFPHIKVVESKAFGLLQHNPFTWLVEGDDFVYVKGLYETRKFADDTLNEWVLSLNENQQKAFVDTLYQVVSASKAENLIELTNDWKKSMNGIVSALKEVDGDTKRTLKQMMKLLFEIAFERMKKGSGQKRIKKEK